MSALPIIITTAGLNALVNAQNTGVSNVVIASMGVSPTQIAATAAANAIPGEVKRIGGIAGQVVADDQIYISAADQTEDTYIVRTIGLYLDTGVLFAVYSQAAPLLEKAGPAMAVLEAAIKLSSPQASAIEFSGGGWLNPQASETVQGVLRLATEAEAKAGSNTTRAVTPKGLKGAIDVVVAWINQEFAGIAQALAGKAATVHTHVMGDITGLVAALNAKAAAAHTHIMGDITGLVDALNGKASAIHTHAMSDITGLTNALAGKAAAAHTHVMGDISGLAAALGGKAAAAHTHVISEVTGLVDALNAKAAAVHGHAIADVAGLSAALALLLPKAGGTMSGALTIQAQPAAAGADIFTLKPTDWAPGKPGLFMKQQGATWSITLYDGQGVSGALNIDATSLAINNATVWSTANFNPADKANAIHSHDWSQITGKNDVLLKSATGLGLVGAGPLTQLATPNQYGSLPTGWTSMMTPASFGLLGGYGYLMKTGRRDAGEGWSGIFTSHVSEAGTRATMWFGSTPDAATMPTWARVWSDANLLAASPTEAAAGVATDRFVSPAALWSFARNLGSPGYAVIPGTGLMIQWGISTGGTPEGEAHAYLPIAFGGGCVVALALPRNPSRNINTDFYMQVAARFIDRIVFFANRANGSSGNLDGGFEWIALGKVSGTADPAYSAGGTGGGGGLGGGGQVEP